MGFEDLADVHAGGHTQRVQNDVDRRPVCQIRHVFDGKNLGDDTLVAVAASQLVADADLALLGHVDLDQLVDPGREFGTEVPVVDLDVDDLARLTVGELERGVTDLAGLLAEDGPQEPLLRGELGLALWGYLAHQDVAGRHLGADAHDPPVVEVGHDLVGQVGYVPGDLLRSEFGVPGIDLVLVDVDRREDIVLDETLGKDDRVLVVEALPRHEGHQQVLAEG